MMRRSGAVVIAILVLLGSYSSADAAPPGPPVNQSVPALTGSARVGGTLIADPGAWTPAATSYRFTWLRDAVVIGTTTTATRTLTASDYGTRISVRVVASNETGDSAPAESAQTSPVGPGALTMTAKPRITGPRRWDHTLTASYGSWSPAPATVGYQWLRDGRAIRGATRRTYAVPVGDFGHRLDVRVTLRRTGYATTSRNAGLTAPIDHRVGVRKSFTYSIATRGQITADLDTFARQVAATYADPRGWRAAGYRFTRVAHGGDFTVVLAAANTVPGFGSPCSTMWSCRVGRDVIINQDRWLHASPAWNAAGLALRSYRYMVVDHETGHWLGHRHRGCPGKGRLAPVMMQQSKGLGGCRFNPFPLPSERWTSR
jgi:hypothetical protein